ncbi:PLD nuclease N-terminal domain-containing protein [Pengzhenrongella frigida]|uniref:PLDc_N domain-containing protein n=1 Tax=Pengzhenrongella frigida TaxID=1259133 RepID=A0A4Q5N1B0_9MICO|nr:PLD nuclease N-terminal domain-containing protein [Cellulomonas sp. HLT2-17]RYV51952.1 PLDc_N domain-containing protein [Cellulomonas sp. HLT2-17]
MPRYLGVLLEIGLIVFCLIECIQAPPGRVRNLPTWAWILLILFIPYVGPIAWLVAGRPTAASAGRSVPWPATRTAGFPEYERPAPDDDPAFIARLAAAESDSDDRRLLAQWEADLRARESRARDAEQQPGDGSDGLRPPGTP